MTAKPFQIAATCQRPACRAVPCRAVPVMKLTTQLLSGFVRNAAPSCWRLIRLDVCARMRHNTTQRRVCELVLPRIDVGGRVDTLCSQSKQQQCFKFLFRLRDNGRRRVIVIRSMNLFDVILRIELTESDSTFFGGVCERSPSFFARVH